MNEPSYSSAEHFSPGNHAVDPRQNELAKAKSTWTENLKESWFIVLLGATLISFVLGYFISQEQEKKKREQWAEMFFRQARDWLSERGKETAGSVEHGLGYVRSAAERAAREGAKYSRSLNPFQRPVRPKFLGIF